MNEIVIFTELYGEYQIMPVAFELIAEAQKLKTKLPDSKISALIINGETDYSQQKISLAKAGFDKVYFIKNDIYKTYSTEFYAEALCNFIHDVNPKIILFGATRTGRDLAPRISAKLSLGLTADCTALDIDENNNLLATRPTFGGNLMATIVSKTTPQMATVRPNVFKPADITENEYIEVEYKYYDIPYIKAPVEIIDYKSFNNSNENNLTEAKIIVTGGKGMKSREGFKLVEELADLLGASVGATRGAIEAGLAEQHIQIGQTGKTVMPAIYIACGVSGAIQHTVGMNMSKKVIAINSDENAPIFKYADYGIIGDVFEILPKFINKLKKENNNG